MDGTMNNAAATAKIMLKQHQHWRCQQQQQQQQHQTKRCQPIWRMGVVLLLIFGTTFLSTADAFQPARPVARLTSLKGQQNGQEIPAAQTATQASSSGGLEFSKLSGLGNCESTNEAKQILEQYLHTTTDDQRDSNRAPLYDSLFIPPGASERTVSDVDLAIQTKIRNGRYSVMELIELNGDSDADRASLGLFCVFVGSVGSALVANQNLPGPEILRFVVVLLLSFAPLAFVGYGIATPQKLQEALIYIQRNFFPVYRKRMIQHEAGHFLMGHLLGFPIKGYQANAVKNAVEFFPLSDPNAGRNRAALLGFDIDPSAEEDQKEQRNTILNPVGNERERSDNPNAPYYSREGRGAEVIETQSVFRNAKNYTDNPFLKLDSLNEPSSSWPYRGFDPMTLDKLTVISVAGVCAELLAFGNAEGGFADFSQLRQIFNSAATSFDDKEADNRIRFAIGYTMGQLRQHLGALDALAEVMEDDGSVAECVYAIETCRNVSGENGIFGNGDYDQRRREQFRSEGIGLVEKLLLSGKTADVEDTRVVTGKGGGYKKEDPLAAVSDDPLYAAIAVSVIFALWAAAGGLALH